VKQSQSYFKPRRSALIGSFCSLCVIISFGQVFALPDPPKRTALVIGNSKYEAAMGALKNPGHDATAVAGALRKLGFSVIERRDLTREGMLQAVEIFRKTISDSEIALFFYAGHGVAVGNSNYLIPLKSGFTLEPMEAETLKVLAETRLYNTGQLVADMCSANAKCNLIILDACRSAALAKSAQTRGNNASGLFVGVNPPSGSLIAFSTDSGRVAFDGSGKNGLYTEELLKYLTEPGLTIEQVFKRTRASVMKKSGGNQIPAEYSRLIGDDIFLAVRQTLLAKPLAQADEPSETAEKIEESAQDAVEILSEKLSQPDLSNEQKTALLLEVLEDIKISLKDAVVPSPKIVETEKLCGWVLDSLPKATSPGSSQYALMASKALNRRGDARLLLGRPRDALKDYNEALSHAPSDAYIYFNRGRAQLELEDPIAARSDFLAASNPRLEQPIAKALALEALSQMEERAKSQTAGTGL
jgi:hypothetical protein